MNDPRWQTHIKLWPQFEMSTFSCEVVLSQLFRCGSLSLTRWQALRLRSREPKARCTWAWLLVLEGQRRCSVGAICMYYILVKPLRENNACPMRQTKLCLSFWGVLSHCCRQRCRGCCCRKASLRCRKEVILYK